MSSRVIKRVTLHPFGSTDGIPKKDESEQHHFNKTRFGLVVVGVATPPLMDIVRLPCGMAILCLVFVCPSAVSDGAPCCVLYFGLACLVLL